MVFAALILLQLLQIGYSLISKPLKSPQPVATAAVPRPQRSGVDIQTVVSAHLFGVAVTDQRRGSYPFGESTARQRLSRLT